MTNVARADWLKDNTTIRHIRYLVFVEEQKVPLELDFDGRDPSCTHVLGFDHNGVAVATGRIQQDGKIGRMAVLPEARRKGRGGAMLEELMAVAREAGLSSVFLDAQATAIKFYESRGFQAEGETFLDAGIEHRRMTREL